MSTCTREPGTIWPGCKCPDCNVEVLRLAKLYRCGKSPVVDRRGEAWEQLTKWRAAGFTPGLIADMTGIGTRCLTELVAAADSGKRIRMYHRTAAAILRAAEMPPQGRGLMSATGARRRLQALATLGWSLEEIGARHGLGESVTAKVRMGTVTRTHPHIVAAVDAAYRELWATPGPSRLTRARALNQGWLPPLAWDDIDDPDEAPNLGASDDVEVDEIAVERLVEGRKVPATSAEIREAARRLSAMGVTDTAVAERVGVSDRTVTRWRVQAGERRRAS